MSGRAARRAVAAAYPRRWRHDGRTEEMLEVLDARCAEHPGRVLRAVELANAAAHGLGVRLDAGATARGRLRVAQLSLASMVGLAVMLLLLAEWLPGRDSTAANNRFGPFISPGAVLYLSVIAIAVLVLARAVRPAFVLAVLNVAAPAVVVMVPHVADQTRPSGPALAAFQLFSIGLLLGWKPLNRSTARSAWPALVGLVAGGATWFTNRTISPADDRLAFYGSGGGLDNVATVAVFGVGAAVVVALVVGVYDRSWLAGVVVTSGGWAALGIRVGAGLDGPTLIAAYCATLVVAYLAAKVAQVNGRRPMNHTGEGGLPDIATRR